MFENCRFFTHNTLFQGGHTTGKYGKPGKVWGFHIGHGKVGEIVVCL